MANIISNTVKALAAKIQRFANAEYPGMAGKMALRFIDDNFRSQSYEGVPWKARKKGAKRNVGRSLLINKGILRRGNGFKAHPGSAIIFNNTKYASAHNNGFSGQVSISAHNRRLYGKFKVSGLKSRSKRTVRAERGSTTVKAHSRFMRIPRRQFMPTAQRPSPTLNRQVKKAVELEIMKILKNKR